MTHPTDDELEAMAAALERWADPSREYVVSPLKDVLTDTAAMLRACKGRAVQKITVTQEMQERFAAWFRQNYPGPDTIIHKPDWHAPKIFRAALGAVPLSALEPARDARQEAWNAAIEAAAKVAREMADLYGPNGSEAAIRQLKKGPDHD